MSRMRRLAPCPRGHGALCRPYTLLGLPLLRPTRVTAGWNPNVDRCSAAKPINPHTGVGSRTARVRMCQAPDDGLRPGGLHPSYGGLVVKPRLTHANAHPTASNPKIGKCDLHVLDDGNG
jgi:hypothetical protein